MRIGNREHFLEVRLFIGIRLRVVKLDHLAEKFLFEIDKMHGLGHALCRIVAQVEAPFAYVFKVNRRRKPRRTSELLPGESGLGLFLGVIIRDVLAVARVF